MRKNRNLDNGQTRFISPEEKGGRDSISEETLPSSPESKGEKRFRTCKICSYSAIIKEMVVGFF